jgi:predicted RecA/RadA family phage recombinase
VTALSADKSVERYEGDLISLVVKANTTIYKGSLVTSDAAGYAIPAANTAGTFFMGVAAEHGTAGQTIRVYRKGIFNFVAANMAITDIGSRVYVGDSATVTKTVGNGIYVGKIMAVDSATSVWVSLESGEALSAIYVRSILTIPIKLAKLANGDIVTTYTPGFAGVIEKVSFVVTDPATTADKAATLNLEIGTTNLTGGVITLSSAAGGNALTLGKVVDGTAITAANVFGAADTISVEASSVTAFAEGEGALLIVIKNAAAAA